MRRLCAALTAGLLGAGVPAAAAEITRVASSGDPKNPFDLDFHIGFWRLDKQAKITREAGACITCDGMDSRTDLNELRFERSRNEMPLRLAVGLWNDLEIHLATSIVFNDDRSWRYLTDTTDSNSTIANNCLDKRFGNGVGGLFSPTCPDNVGAIPLDQRRIFEVPRKVFRGGLDDITLGVAWAPLSDKRDDTKPKWVLGFDYHLPTADPTDAFLSYDSSESRREKIGDKVHKFDVWFALSKRLGQFDPYFKVFAQLPRRAPKYYSNCDHAWGLANDARAPADDATGVLTADGNGKRFLSYPENCGDGPWDRVETGIKAPYIGGFQFGSEFYAYDDPERFQRVAVDLQLGTTYFSEGRYYNELSDALRKQLYTQDHFQLGGKLSLHARAAEYVALRLTVGLFYETEHFLTMEAIGKDRKRPAGGQPGDCILPVPPPGTADSCGNNRVDLDNAGREINPNFDFRYDLPGRRFRISEIRVLYLMATGVVNF